MYNRYVYLYLYIYIHIYIYLTYVCIYIYQYLYDSIMTLNMCCMCAHPMDICTYTVILFVSFYICRYTCRIIYVHSHVFPIYTYCWNVCTVCTIYDHTSVETSGYCTVLKTNTEDSSRFSDSLASLCRFQAGQRTSGLASTSLTPGPVVDGQNPAQIGVFKHCS